jgi:hypothetical protein
MPFVARVCFGRRLVKRSFPNALGLNLGPNPKT